MKSIPIIIVNGDYNHWGRNGNDLENLTTMLPSNSCYTPSPDIFSADFVFTAVLIMAPLSQI